MRFWQYDAFMQVEKNDCSNPRLLDAYRDEKLGEGKKSLAYALTYQAPDRTLTDKEAAKIRKKIVRRLEHELGAELRG